MQDVKLIRFFIASPGDVAAERDAACRVIHEWNAAHSLMRSLIIEPVRIETHLHAVQGGHPQDLINAQLLERCDFLLAIFWKRLGTPTKSDPSGTVQEFREFGETKGHDRILLFFSTQLIPHDADLEQLTSVREFKRSIQDQGIYVEYNSMAEFSQLFRQQLDLAMNAINMIPRPSTSTEPDRELVVFSPEANTLLAAAVLDERGVIYASKSRRGREVGIGQVCYSRGNDARSEAKWEAGLTELVRVGFIEDVGYKEEVFKLTKMGFDGADQSWYVLLLRLLKEMQSSEHDYVGLDTLAEKMFFGQSVTLTFIQEKITELQENECVEAVDTDQGLMAARLTHAGRKAIRENNAVEFAEPDSI